MMKTNFLKCMAALVWIAWVLPTHLSAQEAEVKKSKKVYQYPSPSTTRHVWTGHGKKLNYEATAGHLPLLNEDGEEWARFFYVSYTVTGSNNTSPRPITFVFNGGPGSSSVWLHMGALGPKRVLLAEEGYSPAPPFALIDNPQSWLDETDLVFIDPVVTGYSRPADDKNKKEFTGYREDIKSIGDFIYKYLTKHQRWNSPKYLCGESYGTTRAAGLSAYLLDRHGIYLNGLILVSSILNFQTARFEEGNDLPHILYLPSFAAIAYHHGVIDTTKHSSFEAFVEEVRRFASSDYNLFLMKGDRASESEKESIGKRLSAYTGIRESFWSNHHHRLNTWQFAKELLRDQGYTVGRFDGAVKGIDKKNGGEGFDFDPSYQLSIYGSYTAALHQHLSQNLKFDNSDMNYEILTGKVSPWSYQEFQNRFLNAAEELRNAIHKNPAMRVLVCNGYYDLATPFFATEYTFQHMFIPKTWLGQIQMAYYRAGHMMYTREATLDQFTKDVRGFYRQPVRMDLNPSRF